MIHALTGRLGAAAGSLGAKVSRHGIHAADIAAAVGLVLLGVLYFWQLDGWLINDDEGSYLYAAWRISLGELPYRDFLTPQLPAFLLPGGLLMRLTGPEVLPARSLAVVLTLGSGIAVWATARRLFAPLVALIAGATLLLHPAVFQACRTYRPEPFMLFFATVGVALFAKGAFPRAGRVDPPSRGWLAAAGVAFGLATLSKLFGPFVMAGCLAWLLADAYRRRRSVGAVARDVLCVAIAWGAVVALGLMAFVLADPGVYDAVLGHHLRQGSGDPMLKVASQGLVFYTEVLRQSGNGLLVFVSIAVAWVAWRAGERRPSVFGWQLPTALVFMFMSRQLFPRHIIYLVPAMVTLFALAVWWLAETGRGIAPGDRGPGAEAPGSAAGAAARVDAAPGGGRQGSAALGDAAQRGAKPGSNRWRWLAGAITAGLLVPWLIADWHWAWEWEAGTERIADFTRLLTAPDDIVLSDYSELNFYAGRPTTHSGASLSAGAARSGQIGWGRPESPNRLMDELDGVLPPLVIVDTSEDYGHLRFLRDGREFEDWLAAEYGPPLGRFTRHHQTYDVYTPIDSPEPTLAAFAGGPTLLAAAPDRSAAAPTDMVDVVTAWQSDGPSAEPLGATLRLVDSAGREWAQSDVLLHASGPNSLRVRTTDEWHAGELAADRLPLIVPPGTPPGDYQLTLGLYGVGDLSGLDATTRGGEPIGRQVPVGQLRVESSGASSSDIPPGSLAHVVSSGDADGLRLLGRGALPEQELDAGEVLPLELWWHGYGGADDRLVHVTLGDPGVGSVAADWTEPLGVPGSGSSTWPESGTLVRQLMRVPVLAHAADGAYRLTVSVVDASGAPIGSDATFDLGEVRIAARDPSSIVTQAPKVDRALDARFGSVADLHGVSASGQASADSELAVELVWRALTTPATAFKTTVQVLDESGTVVAQHDAEPAEWGRPTTGWLPGEFITDLHVVGLPPDLPPGEYRLVAGMYDPRTLVRLPATGSDTDGESADLGVVVVE